MKQAQIELSYYKQGDDLASFLRDDPAAAMLARAEMLRAAARILEGVAEYVIAADETVEIHADTHFIGTIDSYRW